MHVNSTVALCPPVFPRDNAGAYYPSRSQKWIWGCWIDYWSLVYRMKQQYQAELYVVVLGETCDKNTHSGYELISPNESDIINAAITTLSPARDVADYLFICRGTEAHTQGASWFDEMVAKEIGAEPDEESGTWSYYWLPLNVEGVRFGFAHHPGTNSIRPWTRGNAANRAAAMVVDEFYAAEERPQVAVFGHVHHDEDSYDNHPMRAMFLPSWSLHTAYDSRSGRAYKTPKIGGNIFTVSDGRYRLDKRRYQPKRRKFWTATRRS